jgi:hypothetical protein
MAKDLTVALDTVEMTYGQIKQLADEMLLSTFTPINDLIATVSNNIEGMSTEMLRDYLLRVQLAAFSISELKDRASVKATCAEAIRKEAYATSYLAQEGTQSAKDASATLAIAENIVAQCLYELVASLVKTKLDSLYRMADTMKSVLMSRMQEAKFMNLGTTNEVSPTTNGRVTLNE